MNIEPKFPIDVLKKLYKINSTSSKEERMSLYVQELLSSMDVDYTVYQNQIYNVRPDTILLAAHLDQVGGAHLYDIYDHNGCLFGDKNLGADDKNGVWIILNLINEFRDNVSFIFSTGEEAGCDIDEVLDLDNVKELPYDINFALIFDREGRSDIIGTANGYCEQDMEDFIKEVGKSYNYKPTMGIFSDCNVLSYYSIPCVNLSCGYYCSHTDYEFTVTSELLNALAFGRSIIELGKNKYFERSTGSFWMKDYLIKYYGPAFEYEESKNYDCSHICDYCQEKFKQSDIGGADVCPVCRMGTLVPIKEFKPYGDNVIGTMYCPDCDIHIATDLFHCPACNTALIEVEDIDSFVDDDEKYYCVNCDLMFSEEFTEDGQFCTICKTPLMCSEEPF